jgi:hypothetical protein
MRALLTAALALPLLAEPAGAFSPLARSRARGAILEDTCLRCHGNQAPPASAGAEVPPRLASAFSMRWKMNEFVAEEPPPYAEIPVPHQISRGWTHYDWPERKMTEIYGDRCINIFPGGNAFSCQFLSDHGRTYFIRYDLGNLAQARSCCLWSKDPFWAPRPDVLANMRFQKTLAVQGQDVKFWLLDIPLPGPFGYGTAAGTARPVAFWFPVIDAWVQQDFFDYEEKRPDATVFSLPEICQAPIDVCDI